MKKYFRGLQSDFQTECSSNSAIQNLMSHANLFIAISLLIFEDSFWNVVDQCLPIRTLGPTWFREPKVHETSNLFRFSDQTTLNSLLIEYRPSRVGSSYLLVQARNRSHIFYPLYSTSTSTLHKTNLFIL